MNNPAITQRLLFEAGVQQLIKDVETTLQLYTEFTIAMLVAALCVFLWLVICEVKESVSRKRVCSDRRPGKRRGLNAPGPMGAGACEAGYERLPFGSKSVC